MNREDLINYLATKADISKEDANRVLVTVVEGISDGLQKDGIAYKFILIVQNLRIQKNYNAEDYIIIYVNGDEEFNKSLQSFEEYIKKETLAVKIEKKENLTEKYDLNNHEVYIEIEKAMD